MYNEIGMKKINEGSHEIMKHKLSCLEGLVVNRLHEQIPSAIKEYIFAKEVIKNYINVKEYEDKFCEILNKYKK
jgi:hypothetical protein